MRGRDRRAQVREPFAPFGEGLILRDVTAGYGAWPVLRGVSVEVPPGELVGLIGPNGSGKTTLVRVASRALAPAAGTVRVQGADPYRLSARQAARLVAVVPQEVTPAFSYSVMEVVAMGRAPYRSPWGVGGVDDWGHVRRALAAANVQHLADRPLEELSGGERQRVVLAQALAQDAPVLLLDEPTTHLDVRHVVDVLDRVRALTRREGRAVLAIFHDLNLAAAYCDRLYALSDGEVVAEGPPSDVVTGDLVREVFGIEAEVTPSAATGRPSVLLSPPVSWGPAAAGAPRAHVIGGAGRAAEVLRTLAERGYEVSAGVLHLGDTDAGVAERLNLLRVTVPPFSSIDAAAADDCLAMARAAVMLVVCDPPFGPGNVANLKVALEAADRGVPVFVVEQVPIEERDFTGGDATRLWRELTRRATVVRSAAGLPRPALRT